MDRSHVREAIVAKGQDGRHDSSIPLVYPVLHSPGDVILVVSLAGWQCKMCHTKREVFRGQVSMVEHLLHKHSIDLDTPYVVTESSQSLDKSIGENCSAATVDHGYAAKEEGGRILVVKVELAESELYTNDGHSLSAAPDKNQRSSSGAVRRKYACNICQQEFKFNTQRCRHMKHVHPEAYLQSKKESTTLPPMRDKGGKGKKLYACEVCQERFKFLFELKHHTHITKGSCKVKLEGTERYCFFCPLVFSNRAARLRHVRKEHGGENGKPYLCECCQERFRYLHELKSHEDQGICSPASKNSETASVIADADREQSPSLTVTKNKGHGASSQSQECQCDICKKKFNFYAQLTAHMARLHPGVSLTKPMSSEKVIDCCFCQKKFGCRTTRLEHMRREHADEDGKLYSCECCLKRFMYLSELKLHIKSDGVCSEAVKRKLHCSFCPMEFVSRATRLKHVRKEHGGANGTPYFCGRCQVRFRYLNELRCHEDQGTCNPADKNTNTASGIANADSEQAEAVTALTDSEQSSFMKAELVESIKYTNDEHSLSSASDKNQTAHYEVTEKSQLLDKSSEENCFSAVDFGLGCAVEDEDGQIYVVTLELAESEYTNDGHSLSTTPDKSQSSSFGTGTKKYACNVCQQEFKCCSQRGRHMKKVHPEAYLQSKKTSTLEHVGDETASKPAEERVTMLGKLEVSTADAAEKTTNSVKSAETESHNAAKRPVYCSFCQMEFVCRSTRLQHMRKEHGGKDGKPYFCEICQKRFRYLIELRCHEDQGTCKLADKSSETASVMANYATNEESQSITALADSEDSLKVYSQQAHQVVLVNLESGVSLIKPVSSDTCIYCRFCPKKFACQSSRLQHMRRKHGGEDGKLYACECCQERFKYLRELKGHTQGGVCSSAQASVAESVNSREDESTKTAFEAEAVANTSDGKSASAQLQMAEPEIRPQNPVICNFCFKEFKFYSQRIRHLKKVHNYRPLKVVNPRKIPEPKCVPCPFCKIQFITRNARIRHVRSMHGGSRTKAYVCRHCKESFKTVIGLRSHILRRECTMLRDDPHLADLAHRALFPTSGDLPFACSHCDAAYDSKPLQQIHYWVEHYQDNKDGQIKLEAGPELSSEIKALLEELKTKPEENQSQTPPIILKYFCRSCEKEVSDSIRSILCHLWTHHVEHNYERLTCNKTYLCPDCGEEIPDVESDVAFHRLQRGHIGRHRPDLKCSMCSAYFNRPCEVLRHEKTLHGLHNEAVSAVCDTCGMIFSDERAFSEHLRGHRSQNQAFQCDVCHRGFKSKAIFEKHRQKHDTTIPVVCLDCGKKFMDNYYRQLHIRSAHLGIYRFKCDRCPAQYQESIRLRDHIATKHEGRKPYSCSFCSEAFVCQPTLSRHIRRCHEGQTPFVCDICGKSFHEKHKLLRHKVDHGEPEPFPCRQCGKAFRNESSVQRHIRVMHKELLTFQCKSCQHQCSSEKELYTHMYSVACSLHKARKQQQALQEESENTGVAIVDSSVAVPTTAADAFIVDSDQLSTIYQSEAEHAVSVIEIQLM